MIMLFSRGLTATLFLCFSDNKNIVGYKVPEKGKTLSKIQTHCHIETNLKHLL